MKAGMGYLMLTVLLFSVTTLVNSGQPIYKPGKDIKLVAYDLDSRKTHLKFSRSYIPLCPSRGVYDLLQDQLPFNIKVLQPTVCKQTCTVRLTSQDVQRYMWMIEHGYEQFYALSADMPALYRNTNTQSEKLVSYDLGFPVGWQYDRTTYLVNNQIELIFHFRMNEGNVEVLNVVVTEANCTKPFLFEQNNPTELTYYYSVTWVAQKEPLEVQPDLSAGERGRWIAIGFIVNIAYCLVIASILYRNLLRDLKNCARQIMGTSVQEFLELSEERSTGWKQHQREVFRPPRHRFILSVLVGAGVQATTVIFVLFGSLAAKNSHYFELESSRIADLSFWTIVFTSVLGGYAAARVYKMWNGHKWLVLGLVTTATLPLTITISLSVEQSMKLLENALSYSIFEIFYMPILWLAASLPLGIIGSMIGFKRNAIKNPFSFHAVQQKRKYEFNLSKQLTTGFLASLVPYLSFAGQYRLLLDSFWMSNRYDLYPLLVVASLLLVISSGLASLFTTYQSLNRGNPKWWGLPFATSFGLALCFVAAQTLYLIFQISMTRFTSIVIYFCWSLLSVWMVFLCCGACSFIFTVFMVRRIYQMIKIE